jgi:hypothetical protein
MNNDSLNDSLREQVTFAVDVNGLAHYVDASRQMRRRLSLEDMGACIDEWPGDFPADLDPGFYTATLTVSGDSDNPQLSWSRLQKLLAYPPTTKLTVLPEHKERKRIPRKKKDAAELSIRVKRDGKVLA